MIAPVTSHLRVRPEFHGLADVFGRPSAERNRFASYFPAHSLEIMRRGERFNYSLVGIGPAQRRYLILSWPIQAAFG